MKAGVELADMQLSALRALDECAPLPPAAIPVILEGVLWLRDDCAATAAMPLACRCERADGTRSVVCCCLCVSCRGCSVALLLCAHMNLCTLVLQCSRAHVIKDSFMR